MLQEVVSHIDAAQAGDVLAPRRRGVLGTPGHEGLGGAEDEIAQSLAESLAESLLAEGGWYADFTVQDQHVIVFADRIFRYTRGEQAERAAAEAYGRSVGVPDHQLDWGD